MPVLRWLSRLIRGRELDQQVDAEIRFHFEEHVREAMAAGLSRRQAERDARLTLGGPEQVKERTRDVRGTRWLEDWWQDTRFTLRGFAREPAFAGVAILTLGLGIGSAIAIFSVVYPVLFEPLAYPAADRLVSITDRADDGTFVPVTFGTYRELDARSRVVRSFAVYRPYQPTLTGEQEPERLDGQLVSADYFRALGVAPALGPGFAPQDDRPGGPEVVVLSDGLWRRRFGGDARIVGRDVLLDGRPARVVGVMPPEFENVTDPDARIWSLLQYDSALPSFEGREWGHHLGMIGRILPDASSAAAQLELDAVAENPHPGFPRPTWASLEHGLLARPLRQAATASARPVLLALLGAVLLLLAIACVNVANLVLARGERRRPELTMRAALGAGRSRLTRQLLTEGLVLAALGGGLGLLLATFGIAGLVALAPAELPRLDAAALNAPAFVFALVISSLVALAAGLAPTLGRSVGDSSGDALDGAGSGGHRNMTARRILVVGEVAIALVLLVGAGLMVRTLGNLFAVAPGFEPDGALVMQVQVAGPDYSDDDAAHRFYEAALETALEVPGVRSAAWTSQLPLSGDSDVYGLHFDETAAEGTDGSAFRYAVTPDYHEAIGLSLLGGRFLEPSDDADAPSVVVINESLARRAFPTGDPIGGRLNVGRTDLPPYTVVGVVTDVKQSSLGSARADAAYVTPEQWYFADRARWLVVRTELDPLSLVPALEGAIWSVDANQPIVRTETLRSLVTRSEAQRRFALIVLEAFAALAVVLATVGLYGVLSGWVAERSHEIGIRSALGATRRGIVSLVVRQGVGLTGLGVLIGLVAAGFLGRALTTLLFGVSSVDPITYAAVTATLLAVSALACWVPASRAARVDPVSTLRAD